MTTVSKLSFLLAGVVVLGPHSECVMPPRVEAIQSGNMSVIPDLNTLHPVPWMGMGKYKIGELLCETYWLDDTQQDACPRYVARRQVERLSQMGYKIYSGFELEFHMSCQETKQPLFYDKDYMCNRTVAKNERLFLDMERYLLDAGVDIDMLHTEHGAGMMEGVLRPKYGIKSPDMTFIFIQGILEMADKNGYIANFMSKRDMNDDGNGLHFSHSIYDTSTGANIFYDPNKPDNLSDIAKHWIAGLVKHSGAMAALLCPTVNCYRRLFRPWAPGKVFWGIDNRFSAYRAKNKGSKYTYIENRVSGGKANPYLVFAATVAAGLDGVINKLECPAPNDEASAKDLPRSLSSALEELQADKVMVDALSEEFVEWYVQNKKEVDIHILEGPNAPKEDPEKMNAETLMYC